jgi:hypothetical protein
MKVLLKVVTAVFLSLSFAAEASDITVYKSPTCGCCSKWVRHLEQNGFTVKAYDVQDVNAYKERFGVPVTLGACHTAMVDGYVVEGHVPADDIKRLLAERPKVKGIAVAGMPSGSPGMESPTPERYEVQSFDAAGAIKTFARH